MKKLIASVWILVLSASAKAADFGVDVSTISIKPSDGNVVAREGTGTCAEAPKAGRSAESTQFDQLRLSQIRALIKRSHTVEQKDKILEQVFETLEAE